MSWRIANEKQWLSFLKKPSLPDGQGHICFLKVGRGLLGGVTVFKLFAVCASMFCALLSVAPAEAQEKTGIKPGFVMASGSARIILMRPSVRVGEQSTGGMFEPNADWTSQARQNLDASIKAIQAMLGNEIIAYEDATGQSDGLSGQYRALFTSLADSVREYQFFPGNRLPTKKRKDSFEWTIGPDIRGLPGLENADYVLFVTTEDHYGSAGRKALQIFAAMAGVGVTSGVHIGYAGLIDVRTGELVWLNADLQMGGDVRTPEGAKKRVAQLLEGFPGRPEVAAAQ
jgi:hypothetical protein